MVTTKGIDTEAFYTVKEASRLTGKSYQQLYRLHQKGALHFVRERWTERLHVSGEELRRFIAESFEEV